MATNKPQMYLLAYDIADEKRLIKVHRTCRRWGVPVQYSVFLVPLTPREIPWLLQEIGDLIHQREDDVRVYPLPSRVRVDQYGRQGLPDGIELVGGRFGGEKVAALAARRGKRRTRRKRRG